MKLKWYMQRLSCMTPSEVSWRLYDKMVKSKWRKLQEANSGKSVGKSLDRPPTFRVGLPAVSPTEISESSLRALLQAANDLVSGHWKVFSCVRQDMDPVPDWFLDPKTGVRSPDRLFSFDINHRNEGDVGNVKYVWELSRHQHLTLLATAYYFTREPKYAECVARHLQSWWLNNPFLSGIHWTSGIEIGVRLVSWVWIRRLLNEWQGCHELFESNDMFRAHLYRHQQYLITLPSRGSSANNHLLAEACGLFMASCSFPYFPESERWRSTAAEILCREIPDQTFSSGVNKELATDYHGFVLELCLAAALEGEVTHYPLGDVVWKTIQQMTDSLAAMVDVRNQPPRQGDSDDALGLLLDEPLFNRWQSLLATGKKLFGACEWWPQVSGDDIRTQLMTALCKRMLPSFPRPVTRPDIFSDAGMVIMRGRTRQGEEIWCRCDHGPHGFNRLAAHAHADALSVEIRVNGVEILADPGTYCYHGESDWRNYFRSTIAHNTLELFQHDQSDVGGPFMWTRSAISTLKDLQYDKNGAITMWRACHDGYAVDAEKTIHSREVSINEQSGQIMIRDFVESGVSPPARLAFHLGPDLTCEIMKNGKVSVSWNSNGVKREAMLSLPIQFEWQNVRGQMSPPLGWYSHGFDSKVPIHTLIGTATLNGDSEWTTTLQF